MPLNEIIERDELGRIVKNTLTPEAAKEMQARSIKSRRDKVDGTNHDKAVELLRSKGLEWEEAPEDLRQLAEQYQVKGDAATMTLILKQTGTMVKTEKASANEMPDWNPEGGDPCPLCGGVRVTLSLDDESAIYVAGVLNASNLETGPTSPVEGRKSGNGRSTGVPA